MKNAGAANDFPTRLLGKTGVRIPILGLGTGPGGMALADKQVIALYHRAIDLGVTYIDSAPSYDNAHRQLAQVLKDRRAEVFLTTKVPVDTKEEALASLEQSLKDLEVEYVDLVFVHSIGGRDVNLVTSPAGSLAGIEEAKKRGLARFIGFTAHNAVQESVKALKNADVDAVMFAMNYADRFTYDFEGSVLPIAAGRNLGILAMKAFAGAKEMKYDRPMPSALVALGQTRLELAYMYAAGLQGVTSVVIGASSIPELEQNVRWARAVRKLTPQEEQELVKLGHDAAARFGEHFGAK